ncbi:MAG TPA: hypothetical protein VLD67_05640, partial [Vicinamibacterales bacterium]|nr:hypothetical protein [Vicinamibacterales bacterium]
MTHNNAVTTGIVLLLLTTGQQSRTVQAQPSGAEFPPQDRLIWVREQAGLTAALAARRLTEALDDPDTAHLLAQVRNFDGMLRALRVIVDTQPRRIPDAFEAVGDFLWGFRGDDDRARQHATTLQQIVADARKRLPDLPREAAARAERVFVNVDAEFSSDRRREWKTALTRFIEQYRGTEAALLAEVDVISAGGVSQELFDALDGFIQAHPGTTAAAKALYQKGFQWHTINT